MASRAIYLVVAVIGMVGAGTAAWWLQKPGAAAPQNAAPAVARNAQRAGAAKPISVEVAHVRAMAISDEVQAVGSLRSRRSVVLRPEVSGRVTQLHFRDGARVRQGQLLVQLDDQLPRAQVQQAQAELSIARANHQRNQELVAQGFISQRSVDESAANLQVAQAKLALAQATAARLKIVAPFDGIAGIGNVHVGDYLKDGTDIVNIEDIDSVWVDFRLPERYQTQVRVGQGARVELDALPGATFSAVVRAIDPQIDANGRSVAVRGSIDNRDLQLRPGMFARVTAVFGARADARVVPEEAIVPQGSKPYVLKVVPGAAPDSRIAQRVPVQLGLRRAGQVEVLQGLELGDTVVTAGHQRVQQDGAPVRVVVPAAPEPASLPTSAPARQPA
ncbi:efflux RND transporter periplasmic adaptor subunit [Simplicispira metamorpha]|uniref:Membrane fusion protein (Multidrug efflux system) n=1 Tax=Simplicispira metamorpha TaxID=80881 RepID=A0A4R2N712_9BURK|nr:efflux RND transporter periplasmic adaptor subunit [Simplicispira metamorpha]TCP16720.1 membrane fusion protein (multidrug efflux system) [Simplicispira metamorpha]